MSKLACRYENDNRWYQHPLKHSETPSVTTVLGIKDKDLTHWAAYEVAKMALDECALVQSMIEEGKTDAAFKMLKGRPYSLRKQAAEVGTAAHVVLENLLNGVSADEEFSQPLSDAGKNAEANVRALVEEVKPTKLATEFTVWSYKHGYSGSADALLLIDGQVCLIDLKTSSDIVPDMALQLAAYRYADVIINGEGKEIPMPKIDKCMIWHAPKKGKHKIRELVAGPEAFSAFLGLRKAFEWQSAHSKSAIVKPLTKAQIKELEKAKAIAETYAAEPPY